MPFMDTAVDPGFPLYHRVAAELERAIAGGSLRTGDRLPSVRALCQQHGISASTATQAYRFLENRALVEARPKSGYFVARAAAPPLPEPELDSRMHRPGYITGDDFARRYFLVAANDLSSLPSVCSLAARSLLPEARLRQLTAAVNRRHPDFASHYNVTGSAALRREIARRGVGAGVQLHPDEIVLTMGGTEALLIALRAVARPGDTIALESPTYFMMLEVVKSLGLKSLEIPTHPRDGISIEALDFATRTPGTVQAAMVIPNFHNPLGSLMPVENKRRLVALAAERGFTLIESDVYGETHFGDERPPVLKAYDTTGNVILCSSFSKVVAPGYRVGWMAPGRHLEAAQALKFGTSIAGPRLPQEVLAQFLQNGGYDHHLRRLRAALKQQAQQMTDAVTRHFPAGCRMSQPQGGLMLWIELPAGCDSRVLFDQARAEHIGIAPGATFSCSGRYDHFIRLHFGDPWTPRLEANIRRLSQLVAAQAVHAGG
jgi:DNA-binding transcriptional MocR family regulator